MSNKKPDMENLWEKIAIKQQWGSEERRQSVFGLKCYTSSF